MSRPAQTVSTLADTSDDAAGAHRVAYLCLSLQCDDVSAPQLRVALPGTLRVTVGRGVSQELSRAPSGVRLRVPDSRMSSEHARFVARKGSWSVSDAGSKNGIRVNGTPCTEARLLRDQDVIEIGRSFFVFREHQVCDEVLGDVVDGAAEAPIAFRTLSPTLAAGFTQLRRVARTDTPVLLCGETGTGKELVSRAIHDESECPGKFVALNCGALAETLVEAELFGHLKGAFSGATGARDGFIRAADNGTLLLDEIAELSPESQVALLRALQESEVVPVGCEEPVSVKVRFVAATHQDVRGRIQDGRFRRDLYTRLAAFELTLPSLRDRVEDLGLIAASILAKRRGDVGDVRLRSSAARLLFSHDWPGNIRELDNVLRSALSLAADGEIRSKHLPAELRGRATVPDSLIPQDDDMLRDSLIKLYRKYRGNVSAVAREMGKARTQIHRWNRRFSLDPTTFKE